MDKEIQTPFGVPSWYRREHEGAAWDWVVVVEGMRCWDCPWSSVVRVIPLLPSLLTQHCLSTYYVPAIVLRNGLQQGLVFLCLLSIRK